MRGRHVGECGRQCLSAMTTVAYCMRLAALDWSYSDLMVNGHDEHGSSSVLPFELLMNLVHPFKGSRSKSKLVGEMLLV